MNIQELVPIGPKTTMKIGGQARYFADITTKAELEEAAAFAKEKSVPLIVLGAGSNSVFADEIVEAVIIRLKADSILIDEEQGERRKEKGLVTVQAGAYLATLIMTLAKQGLDLSALTGIPGTIGGAIFGNAGQGAKGIWIDHYVQSVDVFADDQWKTMSKEECQFRYRETIFKDHALSSKFKAQSSPIIWSATLAIPNGDPSAIEADIERLLKKRIETQPHIKTAGSCFKSLPDGTPAWQLIEAAGLRGFKIGGIEVSKKHANFLLNVEKGSFDDLVVITKKIREAVPRIAGIEMRLYGKDGKIVA